MNENSKRTFPVSWEELHRNAKALAWRLLELHSWHGVIAVTRGGLVPAAIVARELDLRVVDTVCISSYDHQTQRGLRVLKSAQADGIGDGTGWVVVDDLVDTGATAVEIRKMLPKAHLATIYAKPAGKPLVDTYVTEVSQDTWIHFPWDLEAQYAKPIKEGARE